LSAFHLSNQPACVSFFFKKLADNYQQHKVKVAEESGDDIAISCKGVYFWFCGCGYFFPKNQPHPQTETV